MKNKKNVTAAVSIIILITTVNFTSCEDSPTKPEVEPGRRDYTWEVDTIQVSLAHYDRIWGNSPEDVWIIGRGGGLDNTIHHFDGNIWENDGVSRAINPTAIWGFDSNNIWIGGFGGIFNYDGKTWNKIYEYTNPLFDWMGIQDVWGDSPNNVWAIGFADSSSQRKGIIFNYNGVEWSRVKITNTSSTMMKIRRGRKSSESYYIWGLVENDFGVDTTKIFKFNGKKLTEIYSNPYNQETKCNVQEINDEIYFTIGNKIYRNNIDNLVVTNNFPNYFSSIYGRNYKDIFWSMDNGITHYNGSDIQYILNYSGDIQARGVIFFENETFILTNDFTQGLNLVYKGTLKE